MVEGRTGYEEVVEGRAGQEVVLVKLWSVWAGGCAEIWPERMGVANCCVGWGNITLLCCLGLEGAGLLMLNLT